VKKHVERAPHDNKYVITTYDGKHNHEVPSTNKTSISHGSSGSCNLPSVVTPATAFDMNTTNWAAGSYHLQDPVTFGFYDNYLSSTILGTSSKKFPALPSTLLYDQYSFGLNSNHHHRPPPFPTSLPPPSSLQSFSNISDQPDNAIPIGSSQVQSFPSNAANDWT